MIELFEHNKTAYEAAAVMLSETGKAAVIHPTGTGKSFIGFGNWTVNIRAYRKCGIHRKYLTDERIAALDKIGMVWDVPDYIFEKNFAAALKFYKANGHLDVPSKYVSESGVRLGVWIRNIRSRNMLSEVQISRLNEIGMLWEDKFSRNWALSTRSNTISSTKILMFPLCTFARTVSSLELG